MSLPWNERVRVHQIGQLMAVAADIADLGAQVARKLLLQADVVLIRVRRAEMRIDEVHTGIAEGEEAGIRKVEIMGRRLGWERIHDAGDPKRIREITGIARGICGQFREVEGCEPEERRLTVELQVVLAL